MEARYDNQPEVAKHLETLRQLRWLEQGQWNALKELADRTGRVNRAWNSTHTLINDTLAASGISVEQFAEMIEKGEL